MVVYSKANILFRDGANRFSLRKDDVKEIPDWAAKTQYFAALARDGKIVVSETVKKVDKAVKDSDEKPKKGKKE